jgi:hypothetical protein
VLVGVVRAEPQPVGGLLLAQRGERRPDRLGHRQRPLARFGLQAARGQAVLAPLQGLADPDHASGEVRVLPPQPGQLTRPQAEVQRQDEVGPPPYRQVRGQQLAGLRPGHRPGPAAGAFRDLCHPGHVGGHQAVPDGPVERPCQDPVHLLKNQVIEFDPATTAGAALQSAIGAGNLRAYVQGQDDRGGAALAN